MEQNKPKKEVKPLSITQLPILERSQFFFVEKTPMKTELLQYIYDLGIRANLSDRYDRMPNNCRLATKILFDKTRPIVYKSDLIDKYGYDVVENAKLYFQNWIKMPALNAKDHLACLGWFIDQLIDIQATSELNKWDAYRPEKKESEAQSEE